MLGPYARRQMFFRIYNDAILHYSGFFQKAKDWQVDIPVCNAVVSLHSTRRAESPAASTMPLQVGCKTDILRTTGRISAKPCVCKYTYFYVAWSTHRMKECFANNRMSKEALPCAGVSSIYTLT